MDIKIDQEKCISCGLCPSLMPNIFILDPKTGKAQVKNQPKKLSLNLKSTIENCPVDAISIDDKNE